MYTQCPECSSVFEISPEHLGAAGGMVQCGVCKTTFNALRRLTELPPETAEPDGTGTPFDTKGDSPAEVESESRAQPGLFDDEPLSDDHLADTNEATVAADEFSHSDDNNSTEDTSRSNETPVAEDTTTDELATTDQDATDLQQVDAEQTGSSDENIAEPELDVDPEEVEAAQEASTNDANADHSDFNDELVEAGPDDSGTGEDDEATDVTLIDDRDADQSKHNDNEDSLEALPDDSLTGEYDTSEKDESDVDAAEEELNELLEDLDEDDELIIVNPDDLFSTSQVLDEWDIEEGEHDLEAILADETLHDDEVHDDAPETRENAQRNNETDTDSETWNDQQDSNESDSSELEDSDQLEDLEDLDELVEFDEEDLVDQDLTDDDLENDDEDGSDDKDSDFNENNDDVDDDVGDAPDGDLIDDNQATEEQDVDELESPNDPQDTEGTESADKTQRTDSDDEGDETSTSSDSDEKSDAVASIDEADDEVEEPGETEPDSNAVLTEGVTGQFDDDGYDDAEDLKDLGHYLSPKKSLARRFGEGSIVLIFAALLLGQYVHHNRTELATHPKFGTHVRHLYSALGKDLRANWKVSDYRVARHTIVPSDDNANILLARATVVNNSGFERPLPLVRLQLKNRWGDPIYGRVFTPDEYFEGTVPDTMTGNGRLEVSLDLVHPAPNEEIGYSFDVCLDTPAGPDCGIPQVFTK